MRAMTAACWGGVLRAAYPVPRYNPRMPRTGLIALMMAAALVAVPLAQKPAPKDAAAKPSAAAAKLDALKKEALADVESRGQFSQQMVDQIFSFGELGFQEFETNRYLIDILKRNGFAVEEGIAGIPTAFMATWGSGKPVIALGSDIDCIPQASQKPGVACHDPIIEGAPGHGEGHNSGQAVNITAAIAVKKIMERERLSGHHPDLAGYGGGARRDQGALHPRGAVQGRRHRALHARRQRSRRVLGRGIGDRPRLGPVPRSSARRRTPRAARGAAGARSTPCS